MRFWTDIGGDYTQRPKEGNGNPNAAKGMTRACKSRLYRLERRPGTVADTELTGLVERTQTTPITGPPPQPAQDAQNYLQSP